MTWMLEHLRTSAHERSKRSQERMQSAVLMGEPSRAAPALQLRMHKFLLYLEPCQAEQEYFGQLEALDLVNCLITPLFFANTLSMFSADLLSSIYCLVLLIKGYQLGLLLLPGARKQEAHRRARHWLILGERILRQWCATPLLGRRPRFQQWIIQQAAGSSKLMFSCRTLVLMSGLTISFWNVFCLPLGFPYQVLLTTIFFLIHFQASVTQMAYPVQLLLERVPKLLLLQHGLETACSTAMQLLRTAEQQQAVKASRTVDECSTMFSALLGNASTSTAATYAVDAADVATYAGMCNARDSGAVPAAQSMLYDQPGRSPDVHSTAGRFIFSCSVAYMVLVVLLVPLYMAWRLERYWKASFMTAGNANMQQQQQELQETVATAVSLADTESAASESSGAADSREQAVQSGHVSKAGGEANTTGHTCTDDDTDPAACSAEQSWDSLKSDRQQLLTSNTSTPSPVDGWNSRNSGSFIYPPIYPPTLFHAMPPWRLLVLQVSVLLGISLLCGELLTLACMMAPGLASLFWQQIIV